MLFSLVLFFSLPHPVFATIDPRHAESLAATIRLAKEMTTATQQTLAHLDPTNQVLLNQIVPHTVMSALRNFPAKIDSLRLIDETDCNPEVGAYFDEHDPKSLHFCEGFYTFSNETKRASMLIHETTHASRVYNEQLATLGEILVASAGHRRITNKYFLDPSNTLIPRLLRFSEKIFMERTPVLAGTSIKVSFSEKLQRLLRSGNTLITFGDHLNSESYEEGNTLTRCTFETNHGGQSAFSDLTSAPVLFKVTALSFSLHRNEEGKTELSDHVIQIQFENGLNALCKANVYRAITEEDLQWAFERADYGTDVSEGSISKQLSRLQLRPHRDKDPT